MRTAWLRVRSLGAGARTIFWLPYPVLASRHEAIKPSCSSSPTYFVVAQGLRCSHDKTVKGTANAPKRRRPLQNASPAQRSPSHTAAWQTASAQRCERPRALDFEQTGLGVRLKPSHAFARPCAFTRPCAFNGWPYRRRA